MNVGEDGYYAPSVGMAAVAHVVTPEEDGFGGQIYEGSENPI